MTHPATARAALAALLISAAVVAGRPADQEPAAKKALLRHHFVAGQTLTYRGRLQGRGTITLQGSPQAVHIDGRFTLRQRVLTLADDGSARIASTVSDGVLTFRTPAVSQRLPITLPRCLQTISPDGRSLKPPAWQQGGPPTAAGHINLRGVVERLHLLHFPAAPVGLGDTWQYPPPPAKEGAPAPESPPSASPGGAQDAPAGEVQPPASAPEDAPAPAARPPLTWRFTAVEWRRVAEQPCLHLRALADASISDVVSGDSGQEVTEIQGAQHLETQTDFAPAAGRLLKQVASTHTTLRTTTHGASSEPIVGETDITAQVTLELVPEPSRGEPS